MADTVVVQQLILGEEPLRRRLAVLKSLRSRHSNPFHWLESHDQGITLRPAVRMRAGGGPPLCGGAP